jgi:hypothetical protein
MLRNKKGGSAGRIELALGGSAVQVNRAHGERFACPAIYR